MEPIFLPQLFRAPERTEVLTLEMSCPELGALMPVQGEMTVVHHGNYLQVEATAQTIVVLTCDRCLQNYNYRLQTEAEELIWLQEATLDDVAAGVIVDDEADPALRETLPPNGFFDPKDWLYQQLCLSLPQQQLCSADCSGIAVTNPPQPSQTLDQRWSALADLKRQLGSVEEA